MIDCFLCMGDYSGEQAKLRNAFAEVSYHRWKLQSGVNVRLLHGKGKDFQRERRVIAEKESEEKFYVLADDDCLLFPNVCINDILQIFDAHPEFAILSAYPSNANISRWTPHFYRPVFDSDVEEHVSVGGLRFVRADVMTEWPGMNEGPGYDAIQCSWLRSKGWRSGYLRNVKMTHLGEGYSSIW